MTEHTITTTATGRVSAPPDEVDITFSASALEPDVTGARRAVVEQATLLREALDAVDVPTSRSGRFGFESDSGRPIGGTTRTTPPSRTTRPRRSASRCSTSTASARRCRPPSSRRASKSTRWDSPSGRRPGEPSSATRSLMRSRRHEKAASTAAAEDLAVGEVRSIVTDDGLRPRRTSAGRQLTVDTAESGTLERGPIDIQVRVEVEYDLLDSSE